jgi:hypothetical protein
MFGVCMCLFCVCVVPCLGRGLATSRSPVQGVLPSVKVIMKLKAEAGVQKGCRASEKKLYVYTSLFISKPHFLKTFCIPYVTTMGVRIV